MTFGVDSDCNSEATHANEVTPEDVHNSNFRASLGTQVFVQSRQILVDKVPDSIQSLRVFYEAIISSMVDHEVDGYGDSESLIIWPQKRSCGVKFGSDSQQKWNGGGNGKFMEASSCAESQSRSSGKDRYISHDPEALVSSLRSLVSVLKSHEETEHIWRIKLQALRGKKEALEFEKQLHVARKQRHKRQRGDRSS